MTDGTWFSKGRVHLLLEAFSMMPKKRQLKTKTHLPKAQTACSQTFCWGDFNKLRNKGTALASTTAWVCCDVPEAILVKAQAASNCKEGLSLASRHLTKTGKMPELIRASMGGFRSDDNNFLAAWTATSWVAGSALRAFSTMVSKL